MEQNSMYARREQAAAEVLEEQAYKHPTEARALAREVLKAADGVAPALQAGVPEGREMFSVPPQWSWEDIQKASQSEVDFAMTSGAYAPPEVLLHHYPALVALLKAQVATAR